MVATVVPALGRYLGVDTATEACSVALWVDGAVHSQLRVGTREPAAGLRAMVEEVLAAAGVVPSQLDGLACGIGPGSFAGVRTGVAFVQGLALALERRVMPVISLELLASPLLTDGAATVLTALDARMGEVYYAAFRAGPAGRPLPLAPPQVCAPQALMPGTFAQEGRLVAAGSGWKVYSQALTDALAVQPSALMADAQPNIADGIRWIAAALHAGRGLDPALVQPLYLRNKVALTTAERAAVKSA